MGGGQRTQRQAAAQSTMGAATQQEQQRAADFQTQLQGRASLVGNGLPEAMQTTRDTATNMATTGGFTPDQEQQFMRSATAPNAAVYANTSDALSREKALQGGYSPGFSASQSRLTRQAGQTAATTGLNATVALHGQENQNKLAGADLLQKYSSMGLSALNENDINQLRNRLQAGQMSAEDAQLLSSLAAQDHTAFQNIMQGISTIGGAAAGIGSGFNVNR